MSHASYDELGQVIRGVRRRWRLKVALRGAAVVVAAGLVTVAVSAYAMDHFRYEPWAVTSFRLFAYVSLLALTVRLLVVPLWGRLSEERVALYVEEHEPSLQAAVLSAVEAGRRGDQDRPDLSRALVQRLVETAIEQCQTIDYGRQVERQGLRRASGLLAAAASLGMAVAILSPAFLRHAAPFLFAPWSVRAASPYAIDVDPGSATVPRGGNQAVTARLRGFEAESVELAIRSGPDQEWKRWPMTPDAAVEGFQFVLFGLDATSDYFVESNGVRSGQFRLDVADIPYVKRVDLEYHFPPYSGLEPQKVEDSGDVVALQGTEVHVRITPTMRVAGGRLHIDGAAPAPLTAAADGTLSASFEVQKEGFYRVELPSRDGALKTASPDYTIDVLADQPPTVTLTKPGRDAKVTAIEEVFTEMRGEDDFGLGRAELIYSLNGAPEKTLVLHQGRARKSVSAGHTFFLEEHTLEPGDFVSYFARVTDQSPARQTGTTDIYFMEVRPFGRDYRQAEQRGAPGQGGSGGADAALSYQQRQIIAATFKLVRDRARTPDKQFGEDLATLALVQGRLHDQVRSLLMRMGNRGVMEPGSGFAKTAESLQAALGEMASARGRLEARKAKEALPPEQAALKHLQRAEAAFREVQVSFGESEGGGGGGAANAEDLADLFELELDKLKNQYETVQRGQQREADEQVDAALERLRELAQRQEQENERQRRLGGRPPNMGGGGGGGSQRGLAEETEELARRLERLAREKSSPGLQDTARRLQDAANAMRRSSTGAQGGSLGESMAALDRLRDARRRLENERSGRLDRDVQQAVRSAEALREAQRRIAEDAEQELGGRPGQAAEGGEGGQGGLGGPPGARMQRLMERKESLESQVADLEGQLDRMSRDARGGRGAGGGNKDAARKLQEAAEAIRDRKLKEKIRFSKAVARARAADQSRQLEGEIGSDIADVQRRLQEAATAAGASDQDKRTAALERMRDLVRNLESLGERLEDGARGPAPGSDHGEAQAPGPAEAGAEQGESARAGTESADLSSGGRTEPGDASSGGVRPRFGRAGHLGPDDVRQLRRELRERVREAEAIGRDLGATGPVRGLPEVLRDMRRLEDERVIGQPRGLAQLMSAIVEGLKSAEFAMRREAEGPDRQKLFLSGSQDLPPGWKPLVEEYYRSLSRKPGE
jgi:hypothetical protein